MHKLCVVETNQLVTHFTATFVLRINFGVARSVYVIIVLSSSHAEISTQWPDEKPAQQLFDRSILPSAPRASSAPKVDRSRLPTKPPYTVYLGNLSFECAEEDIMRFFERRNIKVRS